MMELESDRWPKNGNEEKNENIQKYEGAVKIIQQDLNECKIEQARIREEINDIICENKNAVKTVHDAFHHYSNHEFYETVDNRECVENLQKQITLIQLEKDSIFQLWQMSLKAVDVLEQEVKETHKDGKTTKYYEDQVINVKETYSQAIKALEAKLIQVKENFEKQQTLWHSTREKINKLTKDKIELQEKLMNIENSISIKDESNREIVEKLKSDLNVTKQELEQLNISKIKLENELTNSRYFNTRIIAKDQESKAKVAEAIELIETAVKEKEIAIQREAMIVDEKIKLESRLANLSDEFMLRLDKELTESKINFEKNTKKYIAEIKELRTELREKTVKMDRIECERRLIEEELEKVRNNSDNYLVRSNTKVLEFEQKFKDSQLKLELCEESWQRKFNDKIRESESRITELEEKLVNANDHLRRIHIHNAKETDERIKELEDRMKQAVERYLNLEKRLTCALDERESINNKLRSLQLIHDREITQRENERCLLESRIRELHDDIRRTNDRADKSVIKANTFERRMESLEKELEDRKNKIVEIDDVKNSQKSTQLKIAQDKYEEKISELTTYVKIHQKLSAKWKEEAQSLASKFHEQYKKLRLKVNILKRENEVLNNELISWRQPTSTQRYVQDASAR